jgi:predicted membrane channel-forming protein YqfA (hemolysin III family)
MDRPQHAVRDLEQQTRLETTCLAVIVSSFGSRAERVTMPVVYTGMYKGERFNSIGHLIGAALAPAGSLVLVTFAAMDGDTRKILSCSVYGLTLFLL